MPETIVVKLNAEVASGPTVKADRTYSVEAYDKLTVAVPDGATDLAVDLTAGAAGATKLLILTSSAYGDELTYKVNAGTTVHELDQPHILTGTGAVALLAAAPAKLTFANALGAEAQVQILIGRDATP